MIKKLRKQEGFTLVELVVVVAIIILLISIILARLDVSRAKARDTKKISELKSLQNALELYQLDAGGYPQPTTQPAMNDNAGLTSMTATFQGILDAKYLSAIPVPPKNSTVDGGDVYFYQTQNGTDVPTCNDVGLGQTPYIIYFYTEQQHNLPKLKINDEDQTNGYCLAL